MDMLQLLSLYTEDRYVYTCKVTHPHCGKFFHRVFPPKSNQHLITELEKHYAKHKAGKPFDCSECVTSLRSEMALHRHMKNHHGVSDPKPFQCTHCNKVYKTENMCQQHMNTHTGEKPFQCKICGESFTGWYRLRDHMQISKHRITRTGPTPESAKIIPCVECGKKFDTPGILMKHMKNAGHAGHDLPHFPHHACMTKSERNEMLAKNERRDCRLTKESRLQAYQGVPIVLNQGVSPSMHGDSQFSKPGGISSGITNGFRPITDLFV